MIQRQIPTYYPGKYHIQLMLPLDIQSMQAVCSPLKIQKLLVCDLPFISCVHVALRVCHWICLN